MQGPEQVIGDGGTRSDQDAELADWLRRLEAIPDTIQRGAVLADLLTETLEQVNGEMARIAQMWAVGDYESVAFLYHQTQASLRLLNGLQSRLGDVIDTLTVTSESAPVQVVVVRANPGPEVTRPGS